MLSIYKYPIPVHARFIISMPADAQILSVQDQKGSPQMWAVVDTLHQMEERAFVVYPTGFAIGTDHESFDEHHVYLGTFQTDGGDFVGHLFELV